jgi:hypothetical protein
MTEKLPMKLGVLSATNEQFSYLLDVNLLLYFIDLLQGAFSDIWYTASNKMKIMHDEFGRTL